MMKKAVVLSEAKDLHLFFTCRSFAALRTTLFFVFPSIAAAQSVSGVVFDSIARTPLAGAIVQVIPFDTSRTGTPRTSTAISDSLGRYSMSGLSRGRYAIGFQHDALSALGLEAAVSAFEIGADSSLVVDLAVPSAAVVRFERCGAGDTGREGMLAGYVTDARQGSLLTGAEVLVSWTEVGIKGGKFQTIPFAVRALVGDEGNYVACGLATDAPLTVRVVAREHRTMTDDVVVPPAGVLRSDFRLADARTTSGTSSLAGRVVTADGSPLSAGRATIASLGVDVPIADGQFLMAALPAGTWPVGVRAIGYEPHSALVDLADGARATATIVLSRRVQLLEAVSVVGKPGKELAVLNDIRDRMRSNGGTAFLPGNSWLTAAEFAADVVRGARGFTYLSPKKVTARGCGTRSFGTVVVYLDGARLPNGLEQLNDQVPMSEILAIETYPDAVSAPYLWRQGACAVIAVWTKR